MRSENFQSMKSCQHTRRIGTSQGFKKGNA